MKVLLVFTLLFSLLSCGGNSTENNIDHNDEIVVGNDSSSIIVDEEAVDTVNITEQVYTKESFYTEGKGWGYKVLIDGKIYINQPHIPAVAGNKGFSSEDNALKTADFAIYKLEQGIMPPTISVEELDSLKVLD